MSVISGKHVARRTMLRGLGATLALPFLDAMVPARSRWDTVAVRTAARRAATAGWPGSGSWCSPAGVLVVIGCLLRRTVLPLPGRAGRLSTAVPRS